MALNVRHIRETLATLEVALHAVERTAKSDALYDVFRLAVIKSFELTIELIAKLLRKSLRAYGGASRSVDTLSFNETIRFAGQTGMLDVDSVARWLVYRARCPPRSPPIATPFVHWAAAPSSGRSVAGPPRCRGLRTGNGRL